MNAMGLKLRMISLGLTVDELIQKLGEIGVRMSKVTFYRKLKGTSEFNRKEILAMSKILNLSDTETLEVFFDEKVSYSTQA